MPLYQTISMASMPDSTNITEKPPLKPRVTQWRPHSRLHTQFLRALRKVNPHKAMGPDGVAPRVLKACAEQLVGVYTATFNISLSQERVLCIFKSSVTVPVPEKQTQPKRTISDVWHSHRLPARVWRSWFHNT